MNNKEILEGNKLIAEFMGGKYDKDTTFPIHSDDIWLPIYGIVNYKTINNGKIIEYHQSWDWLMPVVEKCLIGEAENGYDYTKLYDALCHINFSEIYAQVVEFINWYNLQNKQ